MLEQMRAELTTILDAPGPAQLGPESRPGTLGETTLRDKLKTVLSPNRLDPTQRQLVTSLLLLWHDHLEASHVISQRIENADGSFVHAIMHRREPDYWNSKYWWRRVGDHAAFPEISRRAQEALVAFGGEELTINLLPQGSWDPMAFVDACERVAGRGAGDSEVVLLGRLQRVEFDVLLERFLGSDS